MNTRRTRSNDPADHRCASILGLWLGVLIVAPATSFAVEISLVPLAGSSTGRVGDIYSVGVDLVIGEGEFVTIAAPTLQWDLEGGNVLDVVTAQETLGLMAGSIPLTPIRNDRWRIFDPTAIDDEGRGDVGYLVEHVSQIADTQIGATALWGFDASSISVSGDGILQVFLNGAYQPGTYRLGVVDFLLQQIGTTTISYVTDERFPFYSFFSGSRAVRLSTSALTLQPLDVSATGFAALQIVVIPEPTTGALLGLGLIGLARATATTARRRQ